MILCAQIVIRTCCALHRIASIDALLEKLPLEAPGLREQLSFSASWIDSFLLTDGHCPKPYMLKLVPELEIESQVEKERLKQIF